MANYELNKVEQEKANEFIKWHKKCRPNKGVDHLRQYVPFKYLFTPTGIGNAVEIICPYCGKKRDITDVDSW